MMLFGEMNHAKLIARAAGCGFDPDVNYVISRVRDRDNRLLGGVIYTDFTGRSVMAHIAGFDPRWMSTELMWCIHDFPFNALKVERIFVTVASTNERSMNIAQKMGFEWAATIPHVVQNGDLDVLSMSRQNCRWLKLGWRFSGELMENSAWAA